MSKGWIGVDFDGTLAMHIENKPYDPAKLGEPVPAMLERVKQWLAEGKDVRIVTARVAAIKRIGMTPHELNVRFVDVCRAEAAITEWCELHLCCKLPITCVKDPDMLELWDDRAVQVLRNTGITIAEYRNNELDRIVAIYQQRIRELDEQLTRAFAS